MLLLPIKTQTSPLTSWRCTDVKSSLLLPCLKNWQKKIPVLVSWLVMHFFHKIRMFSMFIYVTQKNSRLKIVSLFLNALSVWRIYVGRCVCFNCECVHNVTAMNYAGLYCVVCQCVSLKVDELWEKGGFSAQTWSGLATFKSPHTFGPGVTEKSGMAD